MAIDYEIRPDGIAIVTYNNPAKMNAVGPADVRRMYEVLEDVRANPSVLAAIVTGAGDRAFSAGLDMRYVGSPEMQETFKRYDDYPGGLRLNMAPYMKGIDIWKPMIAAINGHAIAQSACLALGCDIRIASTNATIAFNEVLMGEIASGGALARLPRQVPYTYAMYLLLTGRPIGAQEMLRYGLVLEVTAPDRLMPRALEIAEDIVKNADRHAVSATKQAVVRGLDIGQSQAMIEEALYMEMVANRHGGKQDEMMRRHAERFRKPSP